MTGKEAASWLPLLSWMLTQGVALYGKILNSLRKTGEYTDEQWQTAKDDFEQKMQAAHWQPQGEE